MKKKKKINKPQQKQKRRPKAEQISTYLPPSGSTDGEHPSFRFTYADQNRWPLSDWTSSEIDDLIQGLKRIEKYTWEQIKGQGSKKRGESVGTGYKWITSHPELPDLVPDDAKLSEMRIDNKKRIFGFRVGVIYYIVWFDRDHSVFPE